MKLKSVYCFKAITFQRKQENHIAIPEPGADLMSNTRRFKGVTLTYNSDQSWVEIKSPEEIVLVPVVNIAWMKPLETKKETAKKGAKGSKNSIG